MFRLLAATKHKRQQIAILIISFFAYVAGIRNEGNNMLQQQQKLLQRQQATTENSNYSSSAVNAKTQSTFKFRPSQTIDFTPADAALPHTFAPIYSAAQHSTNINTATHNEENNSNSNNNIPQKQGTQNVKRRYTTEATEASATHGNAAAAKQFSFANEQQQVPQHLTDKPIYVYRDPFTNENYRYTPTETLMKDATTVASTYTLNNYNNNAYEQQHAHHLLQQDDNQEYLVQSSMIVGTQQQPHQQAGSGPFPTHMSLSDDQEVYLKRPGLVYDDGPSYSQTSSAIDRKVEAAQALKLSKISYDSHDYPPPSYFQQQTSNFLPRPLPAQPSTRRPTIRPTRPPSPPPRQDYKPPLSPHSTAFGQRRPQQPHLQSSQPTLPNYANTIDNYLLNNQQTSDYYRTEQPLAPYLQQQPQIQHQHESQSPSFAFGSRPQLSPPPYDPQQQQQQQYFPTPTYTHAEAAPSPYETTRPPPRRPPYNNYFDYQIGEIPPPQAQISTPPSQHFNYPYPRPPGSYPHRSPPPPHQQQQNGLATLAQYAPQFTSLLLGGLGGAGEASSSSGPLTSLIGALTGAVAPQQSPSATFPSSHRRPVNTQLIKALENIARNDDLQCVPKVLCQMIAAQTQRGQLPAFITSPAITNFLTGFPAASPALIYGRALLLGLSGGDTSCHHTYVKCPKTEYEIIYYLNNHRGGFFKFFSDPEEQHQAVKQDVVQQTPTSLFTILAALTDTQAVTSSTTLRPTTPAPSADITSGIGSFFTQLLSDYMGGATVEYQRRLKSRTKRALNNDVKLEFGEASAENHSDATRFRGEKTDSNSSEFQFESNHYAEYNDQAKDEEDFSDKEDEEDTQQALFSMDFHHNYLAKTSERILQKPSIRGQGIEFFPPDRQKSSIEIAKDDESERLIQHFNDWNRARKFLFPSNSDVRMQVGLAQQNEQTNKTLHSDFFNNELSYRTDTTHHVQNSNDDNRLKKLKFENERDHVRQPQSVYSNYPRDPENPKPRLVFPERGSKILNSPHHAATLPQDNTQQLLAQQYYTELAATTSDHVYNTHINSLHSQNIFSANTAANNNFYFASTPAISNSNSAHFLPTPAPADNDHTFPNLSSQENYFLRKTPYFKPDNANSSSTSATVSNHPLQSQRFTSDHQTNFNQYHSSLYTTRRPTTTNKPGNNNIYVTNSLGVTEYYLTPDGRKVYL